MITADAPPIVHPRPPRERTWLDDEFHNNRTKPVDGDASAVYPTGITFHTVWRSDYPKGYQAMQVTTDQPIRISRPKREALPNPFDEHIVKFNEAYSVEAGDAAKAGRINLDADDKLSSVLRNLRKAAAKINRSIVVAYDPPATAKDARTFRFMLKPKVAPKAKPAADTTPAAPAAPAATAKPKASAKPK